MTKLKNTMAIVLKLSSYQFPVNLNSVFIMETKQFKIEYRLTLIDGSFLETTTYVAAKDRDIALNKLKMWRETQEPKFDKIEFFSIDRCYDVVV